MSSIAQNMNSERGNRWLLIGAALLALVAGVLVFAALAGSGGDGDKSSIVTGDAPVLIAKDTITAGTKLDADMFRSATFADSDLVPGAVADAAAIVGQTARVEILQGQQLSRSAIVTGVEDDRSEQLAFKFEAGERGIAVSVTEETIVGGLIIPGDHVDVIVTIQERATPTIDQGWVRIQTVLQNIEVLAVAQTAVEGVTSLDENGQPIEATDDLGRRPESIDGVAGTVTLRLTPEEVQRLVLADRLGDITLSLRSFGDDEVRPLNDILVPVYD